jgi:hypothetical protein
LFSCKDCGQNNQDLLKLISNQIPTLDSGTEKANLAAVLGFLSDNLKTLAMGQEMGYGTSHTLSKVYKQRNEMYTKGPETLNFFPAYKPSGNPNLEPLIGDEFPVRLKKVPSNKRPV